MSVFIIPGTVPGTQLSISVMWNSKIGVYFNVVSKQFFFREISGKSFKFMGINLTFLRPSLALSWSTIVFLFEEYPLDGVWDVPRWG